MPPLPALVFAAGLGGGGVEKAIEDDDVDVLDSELELLELLPEPPPLESPLPEPAAVPPEPELPEVPPVEPPELLEVEPPVVPVVPLVSLLPELLELLAAELAGPATEVVSGADSM